MFKGALSAKRHFPRKFYLFACFRTLSQKNEDRWRKSFARASNEKSMFLDDCLRKQTLVVRKTLSSFFELLEKKVLKMIKINSAVFSKKNSTFPEKNFARKLLFREYYVFISLFFDIELSVLRLFAEILLSDSQKSDLETQQKSLWEKLLLKLSSFLIFADIEFPSDIRRSFSTGCRNCNQSVQWSVISKRHVSRKF